jgi:hypothetical protein
MRNTMIAANTNTVFKAISFCSATRLVAYAANNTVLIMEPQQDGENPRVLCSLNRHVTRVNAV